MVSVVTKEKCRRSGDDGENETKNNNESKHIFRIRSKFV